MVSCSFVVVALVDVRWRGPAAIVVLVRVVKSILVAPVAPILLLVLRIPIPVIRQRAVALSSAPIVVVLVIFTSIIIRVVAVELTFWRLILSRIGGLLAV